MTARAPVHIGRRALLKGGMAASAVLGGWAARPETSWASTLPRVRLLAFEGQWPPATRDHLEARLGLRLDVTFAADPDEVRDRVRASLYDGHPEAGVDTPFDLVSLGLEEVSRWRAEDLLSPLPKAEGLAPVADALKPAVTAQGAMDGDGTVWLAPLALGATVLLGVGPAADALASLSPPPQWDWLLSEASLAGRVALEPHAAVWIGVRQVDPVGDRLTAALGDAAAARALFQEVGEVLKPYRAALADVWTDAVTFVHHFGGVAPKALAGCAWDGLARVLAQDPKGPPVTAVLPADGAPGWLDGLAMPRNAPSPAQAHRLLAALADPETAAAWGAASGWLPAESRAWSHLPAPARVWCERALLADGGLSRLWFPPRLTGPVAAAFDDVRSRFEFP